MKILVIGDIFSKQGRKAVANELSKIKKEYEIDFVIANAENTTHGRGLCLKHYDELIGYGIDCLTMGNHTWDNPEIFEILKTKSNIIRPYNINSKYDFSKIGCGSRVFVRNNKTIRVTNLLGSSIAMNNIQTNPFFALDEIVDFCEESIHIVDFHCETTSEKNALFLDFKSKVSFIYGTHTHIPTNDCRIFENTAYQTDIGMCGSFNSIIGAQHQSIIERFRDPNKKFSLIPSEDKYIFCSTLIEFDAKTNKPINIFPIIKHQNN